MLDYSQIITIGTSIEFIPKIPQYNGTAKAEVLNLKQILLIDTA